MEHAAQHSSALVPIIVFLIVYAAITFELVNKAAAALAGARTAGLSQKRMNSIREVMMQSDADYKRFLQYY